MRLSPSTPHSTLHALKNLSKSPNALHKSQNAMQVIASQPLLPYSRPSTSTSSPTKPPSLIHPTSRPSPQPSTPISQARHVHIQPTQPRDKSKFAIPPRRRMEIRKILVFGAGNFGSCLADHLADSEHTVYLWARSRDVVDSINTTHRHPKYLKEHDFPESIQAIGPELPSKEFMSEMDVLLFAVPTQYLRNALLDIKDRLDDENLPLLIFVNKGIETGTRALTLEIIADTLGKAAAKTATFLSGPSFAKEIVQRQPTQVSVSSLSIEHAQRTAEVFHQPWFRCYTGDDPIGVELAGALKNVYAIAAGIADGLGYQNNTRAGLITRCLAEMTRVGCAYGASPLTFLSLAGVGDLFLTCSSRNSRNYTVGYRLGQGEKLDVIIDTLGSVAEGVATAQGLHEIIERLGAEAYAPIAEGVYAVLYGGQTAEEMSHWLMNQPAAQRELEIPERAAPYEAIMLKLGLEAKKTGKI